MVAVSELLSWSGDGLAGIGDRLAGRRRRLAGLEGELDLGAPPASWVGVAPLAAERTHAGLYDRLVAHVLELGDVVGDLDAAAAEIGAARQALEAALGEAAGRGFTVSETGLVSPGPGYVSLDPLGDAVVMAGIAGEVRDALARAAAADATLAAVLTSADREDPATDGATLLTAYARPGDPGFAPWFAALPDLEKQRYLTELAASADFDGFEPLDAITFGVQPWWADQGGGAQPATDVRGELLPGAASIGGSRDWGSPIWVTVDGQGREYGYKTGGAIAGPGGVDWPIAQPYMETTVPSDDGPRVVTYMDDRGPRTSGSILDLDGHDPGWVTVASYRGVHQYQYIDQVGLGFAGALAGLDGNRVFPQTLHVTPDGHATLDRPESFLADSRPVAVPDAKETDNARAYDARGVDVANRASSGWNLGMKAITAVDTISAVASHEQRPWFVEYQVNEDGRTRALVRTFQAGATADGTPVVGSFANVFNSPGSTGEYAYAARMSEAFTMEPSGIIDSTHAEESSYRRVELVVR